MNNQIETFYSHGKLLLTGEYLVLQGAKALALPVNLGQKLEVCKNDSNHIDWITFEKSKPVFTAVFSLPKLTIIETNDPTKSNYLISLLLAAKTLNPTFLSTKQGFAIKASVEFSMNWGLGSSSTLINNLSLWAKVNAFKLNRIISKGSGYDIACAQTASPIIYQQLDSVPNINEVTFNLPFLKQLNLLYLNKKVATESNILDFLNHDNINQESIKKVNRITSEIIECKIFNIFQQLIKKHEAILSIIINEKPIKQKLFSDFKGEVKSLGAWGGDFALVASNLSFNEQQGYFDSKGYNTFFPLTDLLNNINEPNN